MTDWYIDEITGYFRHRRSNMMISPEVFQQEIKRLDPAGTYYNTDYRFNDLLNALRKDFLGL